MTLTFPFEIGHIVLIPISGISVRLKPYSVAVVYCDTLFRRGDMPQSDCCLEVGNPYPISGAYSDKLMRVVDNRQSKSSSFKYSISSARSSNKNCAFT